ncbi:CPBP family intramembrane glutamic endopeptidase [Candidatus Enterococcus ferrettii]|uniref:CAAX prenyl protease 2/Lysostaphin resistance protein A-like domain-containing protein n=2 Tax=Enterococcus TaxID=1350 RepID=A0ABV0ERJ1_9ENTE|nr:type II CAAX endopeptidase family protein [Enterococcus sp. 665A]MBO1342016.1 CPBP family intramembrane metalloprotease [Enterococcus sp. 665A]
MTTKKYLFLTIFTYGLVLFSPLVFAPLIGSDVQQLIQITTYSYIVGAVLLLFYWRKSQTLSIEKNSRSWKTAIIFGLSGIFLSMLLQMVLLQIETRLTNQSVASQNTQNIVQLIKENSVFIIATTIAGPIMEELVFRRAIFGSLNQRYGFLVPAIISSLLFAFAHQDGHYLLYGGLGLFFCWLFQHTGKIWTSMLTHVGMNLIVILAQLAIQQTS